MERLIEIGGRLLGAFSSLRGGRRLYIFPTRHGFGFIVVLVGMLVGAANYNNNLAFILTFLLGSMLLVVLFHTHGNLARLEIESARGTPVFAHEPAVFELAMNAGEKERPMIHMKFLSGPESVSDVEAGARGRIRLISPVKGRGVHRAEAVDVWTTYPVGLFRAWTRIPVSAECLVYPAPISGEPVMASGEGGAGEGVAAGEGVEDFKGIRTYQPGDSLRRIAWKQSSRSKVLMTKEFHGLMGRPTVFDFDGIEGRDTEYKLSRLCAMVLESDNQGRPYGLRLPGVMIEPGLGIAHRERCLEALALFGVKGKDNRHGS